ncbi:hypothetical protein [Desulfonatronospira sp.]|uniref:hypothetical protein n=1 Tax=Desulfonatronospira sp. TaxID=1962951 RepID=UPI0025C616C8|nr:hypothetical protein [Desulfonatronospira sp.]
MTEDEFKAGAIDLLARWGVHVAPVPTAQGIRTPDLRGRGGPDLYAFELKQRDSDRVLNAIPATHDPNVPQALPPFAVSRDKAVQSLVRECVRQLRGEAEMTFRIGWVHCEGFDSDTDQVQLQNSFLGTEYLLDRGTGGRAYACHFFRESDFWRYRNELDGAIVSRQVAHDQVNVSVLLNPYSLRADRLRTGTLLASVERAALVDVVAEEAERICLIADCAIDRRDPGRVLDYVCEKYRLDLLRVPIQRYGGVVRW